MLWGVIIALSINSLLYFYSEIRLENLFSGQVIEGQNPWGLIETVRKFAYLARVPEPQVIVLASSSPQAMVMGRSQSSARIYLTEGLLKCLKREEVEAIVAYQVSSIKNLDTLLFTITSAITGLLFFFSRTIDLFIRGLLGAKADSRSRQNHLFSWLIAPLATIIVRATIGSRRYFATDSLAASLLEDSKFLAQALWKLDSYSCTKPLNIPPSTAPLFVVNPLTEHGWTRYFHTHPSVEKRIKNIIGYYPI